jgi:uncharacterized protein with HEPN domain
MKDRLGDRQRLLHIQDSIVEIQAYVAGIGIDGFLSNSMMRFACIKQIEIIGEAANHISAETRLKFSDIEWTKITGMRHILVHEYFGVDFELIWQVIINDLPDLQQKVSAILNFISQ